MILYFFIIKISLMWGDIMQEAEKLSILKDLISINTVNDNEEQIANYLSALFDKHHVKNEVIDQFEKRSNIVAEIGHDSGKVLAFAGHEDTVHENNRSEWTKDPFEATVINDKMYGRGVTDMKAGLAAMAIAIIELQEAKVKLNGRLKFMATISEELTQGGAHYLCQHGLVDDVDSMIIGEPTGIQKAGENQHKLIYAHKGALIYTVKSVGKAAHSSTPELGIDAIDNLINYRSAEKKYFAEKMQSDDDLGTTIYTPDIFQGGKQVNSIPDFAFEQVMVRTIPQLPNQQIVDDLNSIIAKFNQDSNYQLSLEVNFSGNPVSSPLDTEVVDVIQTASIDQLGTQLETGVLSMGTDASQYQTEKPDLNVFILGPGNDTAHRADENIDLKSYYQFIDLYKEVAKGYLK